MSVLAMALAQRAAVPAQASVVAGPVITGVSFAGSAADPTITITGTGFGAAPAGIADPCGFAPDFVFTGDDFGDHQISIEDTTGGFGAGISQPGAPRSPSNNDCIGLSNVSYSDTAVSFQFGTYYSDFYYPTYASLNPGDSITVAVKGVQATAIVSYTTLPQSVTIITPSTGTGDTTVGPVSIGGVPSVFATDKVTFQVGGCVGGNATYQIAIDGTVVGGPLSPTTGQPGFFTSGPLNLSAFSGASTVTITFTGCPVNPIPSLTFPIFVDPSGNVLDTQGNPVQGATVTLYRDDGTGNFVQVPDHDSGLDPTTPNNPETTSSSGAYGWNVAEGAYRVRAEKAGCVSPDVPSQGFVESAVLTVPPQVTGLQLRLDCGGLAPPPPSNTPEAPSAVLFGAGMVALLATCRTARRRRA